MLCYNSRNLQDKKPFGAVAAQTAIAFHVQWRQEGQQNVPPQRCLLYLRRESCRQGEAEEYWTVEGQPDGWQNFHFSFTPQKEGLYFYRFAAEGGAFREETQEYQQTVYKAEFQTPDWLKSGLMYQIFPDRFCRSHKYIPPEITNKKWRMHAVWGELPDCGPDENGIVWNNDFFGGNLQGIIEQLPYLEEIGVTVLYMNPIFEAFSNHRYDTANYRNIDPLLGTEEELRTLCQKAGERGIRVVLDGVFNHTGSHSIYFNKDGAYDSLGACQGEESPYYRWYHFHQFPNQYDSWWGIDTLPAVNEEDASYLDYIVRGRDSIIRHWLSCGISGYRLDVADELPDVFLDEVRRCIKEEDSDACIIGEVWEDASNKIAYGKRRRYLQGEQLDSVMNYPLKDEILAFLLHHRDGGRFMDRICRLCENYPPQVFYALMNLLGTHDTVRIYTLMLVGSDNNRYLGRQRLFLALLVWAFMPGIPSLYYGDEMGMEGARDPMNRKCFPERPEDDEVALFYRRLLRFHKKTMRKEIMEFCPGDCGYGFISFSREGRGKKMFVFLNASDQPRNVAFPLQEGQRAVDFINCGSMQLYADFSGCTLQGLSGIVVEIESAVNFEQQK